MSPEAAETLSLAYYIKEPTSWHFAKHRIRVAFNSTPMGWYAVLAVSLLRDGRYLSLVESNGPLLCAAAALMESEGYPWTTLASILVRKMEATPSLRDLIFPEAIELLENVFRFEERRGWRPTPHPYSTILHCASVFLDLGGKITSAQKASISTRIEKCQKLFPRDSAMQTSAEGLASRL